MTPRTRSTRYVAVDPASRLVELCGPEHRHLVCLERELQQYCVRAESQGGTIRVDGLAPGPQLAERALTMFRTRIEAGAEASCFEFEGIIRALCSHGNTDTDQDHGGAVRTDDGVGEEAPLLPGLRKPVAARGAGQRAYVRALTDPEATLIFAVGAAGTGKTYLAVAAGISALSNAGTERFVVARPAVEAGERLGFLPGAMEDKVDPYMLPIWDCLRDILGVEESERRRVAGQLELAPLAFMRGRTIRNAFILVDEAQNATRAQMKMILTRLGRGSRMVVVGDPSQSDLPPDRNAALHEATEILDGLAGVRVIRMGNEDIVRHDLVGRILRAYETANTRP